MAAVAGRHIRALLRPEALAALGQVSVPGLHLTHYSCPAALGAPLSPAAAAGSALLQRSVQVVPSDSPAARDAAASVRRQATVAAIHGGFAPPPGLALLPFRSGWAGSLRLSVCCEPLP